MINTEDEPPDPTPRILMTPTAGSDWASITP